MSCGYSIGVGERLREDCVNILSNNFAQMFLLFLRDRQRNQKLKTSY
jgi:hypothetical protein